MNDQAERGLPCDEHLRAALRHAPDASVGAPADLSVQIRAAALRAATVAAAPASPPPVVPAWPQRLWSWLGKPVRMGASGAFATLLIATVIGLVWRSEGPPVQVHDQPATARPQSSTGTMPDTPASALAPSIAAAGRDTAALSAAAPAAERRIATPDGGAGKSPPVVATPTTPPSAALERPSQSLTAAIAPASAQAKAVPGRAESSGDSAAPAVAPQPAVPQTSTEAARSVMLEGSLASSRALGAAAGPDFASWLDEALTRTDAPQLLAELAAFTQGRWMHAAAPPQDRPAVDLPANGRTAATLTLGDDAVWGCLTTPALRCQRAPFTPEQASRLRELLAQRR